MFKAIVLLLSVQAYSASNINAKMKEMAENIESIMPYVYSENSFKDETKKKIIERRIKRINVLFNEAQSHFEKSGKGLQISAHVMKDHLNQIENVMKEGHESYSQEMAKHIPQICIGCHTQDSKSRKIFRDLGRSSFPDDFSYGEFLMSTRNYSKALQYYAKALNDSYGKHNLEIQILKRMISADLKYFLDIDKALKTLEQVNKVKELSKLSKNIVIDWIDGLKDWQKQKDTLAKIKSSKDELFKFTSNYFKDEDHKSFGLSNSEHITYIILSGLLYHHLNTDKDPKEVSQLLYWLALSDRALNYNFFYSLSDLYLKECIRNKGSKDMSKKCFNEYREHTIFSYTGSRGTVLPRDVQEELKALEKALQ